jgi:hypothetical protein
VDADEWLSGREAPATDDRAELERMGVVFMMRSEQSRGGEVLEATIVQRSASMLVVRVLVGGIGRIRTTRAILVLRREDGSVIATLRIRRGDLQVAIDGLTEVALLADEDQAARDAMRGRR